MYLFSVIMVKSCSTYKCIIDIVPCHSRVKGYKEFYTNTTHNIDQEVACLFNRPCRTSSQTVFLLDGLIWGVVLVSITHFQLLLSLCIDLAQLLHQSQHSPRYHGNIPPFLDSTDTFMSLATFFLDLYRDNLLYGILFLTGIQ